MSNARRGSRELRAAALVGLVIAVLVGIALLDRAPERSANSNTRVLYSDNASVVNPDDQQCADVFVPADAATLKIFPGTRGLPGPPIDVQVLDRAGRKVRGGGHPGGYPDEKPLRIRLTDGPTVDPGRVCIRNLGERIVQFANAQSLSGGLSAQERDSSIRLEFLLEGRPRNIELAPTAVRRAALVKSSLIGEWTLWLLPIVFFGIVALAVRLVLREAGR